MKTSDITRTDSGPHAPPHPPAHHAHGQTGQSQQAPAVSLQRISLSDSPLSALHPESDDTNVQAGALSQTSDQWVESEDRTMKFQILSLTLPAKGKEKVQLVVEPLVSGVLDINGVSYNLVCGSVPVPIKHTFSITGKRSVIIVFLFFKSISFFFIHVTLIYAETNFVWFGTSPIFIFFVISFFFC
jgi:hypothetical protein